MFLTTKLGGGEIPKLNIAFSHNEEIRSNHGDRLALLVKFSMIKTILFEVHLPVVSSHGLQRAWDRLNAANLFLELLDRVMACPQTNCINNFKVESEQSKENKIQNIWRSGLPKTRNSYGNRGVVLPFVYYNNIYCPLKKGIRGRTLDFNFRLLSTSAGSPVQIKSNTNDKLLKLAKHCKKNFNGQIQMDKLYRLMYDSALYELAYKKLGASSGRKFGASSGGNINQAGINIKPLDHNHYPLVGSAEMLSEVIEGIIAELKDSRFRFEGKKVKTLVSRPLTTFRNKLVQEVMRMILEVIFEPTFSEHNHGFRPGRGCHSALKEIKAQAINFGVSTWYFEGDISKYLVTCADEVMHASSSFVTSRRGGDGGGKAAAAAALVSSQIERVLMNIIENKIKDRRFTDLIWKALKAGYFEFKIFKDSNTGTTQGDILSPILSNIYLNELDRFISKLKLEYDKGIKPKVNPYYNKLCNMKNKTLDVQTRIRIHKLHLKTPYYKTLDPSFKKLVYVRYANVWVIGVRGSKEDCNILLEKIEIFFKDKLNIGGASSRASSSFELVPKTLSSITNAKKVLFLDTVIFSSWHRKHQSLTSSSSGFMLRNGREIRLEAPKQIILQKLNEAGFITNGKPSPKLLWQHYNKDTIITLYNSVYRYINYYSFAENISKISSWLHFILKTSCVKLLASKFKLGTICKTYFKFGKDLKGDNKIGFVDAMAYGINIWDFKISTKGIIQILYAGTKTSRGGAAKPLRSKAAKPESRRTKI